MSRGPIMVYVQHLLGIGHLMRAAEIIRALQASGLDVTCVSGGEADSMPDLGGARLVQLPPVRAADTSFRLLVGADGRPIDDAWRSHRRDALLAAFNNLRPEVLLIESFPFGRWQFRFELLPLLRAAREAGVRVASSVRDILVEKSGSKRMEQIITVLRQSFDTVLVHGDARLVPFGATFRAADRISDLIRYTGYIAPARPTGGPEGPGAGEVVVAAGGGAVGGTLLRTALAARPLTRMSHTPWRLITGPNLPAVERQALTAPPGVTIETMREDYRDILARAALSVSQAGYNTVMDVLVTGVRAVFVPFSAGNETEQSLRASLLAERGRAQLVCEENLSPPQLAAAIDAAGVMPLSGAPDLNLEGARGTAQIINELLGHVRV